MLKLSPRSPSCSLIQERNDHDAENRDGNLPPSSEISINPTSNDPEPFQVSFSDRSS